MISPKNCFFTESNSIVFMIHVTDLTWWDKAIVIVVVNDSFFTLLLWHIPMFSVTYNLE